MAENWIKMRTDLQTHPKVVLILSEICPKNNGQISEKCPDGVHVVSDRFRVIGGLHAVWSVFDQHSVNGELRGYTLAIMDQMVGFPGLSSAMSRVGWLIEKSTQVLVMPEFYTHNGESAKKRADDNKRKKLRRIADKVPENVHGLSENSRTNSGHIREEKDKSKDKTLLVGDADGGHCISEEDGQHPRWTVEDKLVAATILNEVRKVASSVKGSPKWPDDVRLIRERDGRTHEEILDMFRWANNDGFWRANILSPAKLREKWPQLEAKRNSGGGNHHETNQHDGGHRTPVQKVEDTFAKLRAGGENLDGGGSGVR